MKNVLSKGFAALLIIAFSVSITGCKTTVTKTRSTTVAKSRKPLPPGQAKKVNGDKSAKRYAPGQRKKA